MQQPDFAAATTYVFSRLQRELDSRLQYHSLAHTRDDVLPAVERLAAIAGVSGEPLLLVRTAAVFHDAGFLIRRLEHETAGIALAATVLPRFGYNASQVATVGELIMATRMPQTPLGLLGQLLADADLDLLGRDDFLALNEKLRAELRAYGEEYLDTIWYRSQLAFVSRHRYWSAAARELRDAGKLVNLELLRVRLAKAEA
jgi:uncharacterized protein